MFQQATSFNADVSAWDTSSVTNMGNMFDRATSFNANISAWDVSSVTSMKSMFQQATSFNSDISAWNTNVTHESMFQQATSFNADVSAWDTSSVTNMYVCFMGRRRSTRTSLRGTRALSRTCAACLKGRQLGWGHTHAKMVRFY